MPKEDSLQCQAENYLKSVIAEVTESRPDDFDSRVPFAELAIDSFRVLKIVKRLERDFGNLRKTLLFEYFNVAELAGYFAKEHSGVVSGLLRADGADGAAAAAAPVPVAALTRDGNRREAPLRVRERLAWSHPEYGPVVRTLFEQYRNEAGASRGAREIAPYLFIGREMRGYFNYARCKDVLLAYAYTGPHEYFAELAGELHEHCRRAGLQLNIFTDRVVESIGDVAYSSTPVGVLQRIADLQQFSLEGGAMRRLRYQVSKFGKSGEARTEEYRCGGSPATDRAIAAVIDQWCAGRSMVNPLIHTVKAEILQGRLAAEHRIFVTYLGDVLQNAILISPLSESLNGYLMDLEFYGPEMPLGGLEFAIVKIVETLVSEGRSLLSLGGTYGCRIETCASADAGVDRVLNELQKQGIFKDEGNLQFKSKFRPENRSIFVCRPAGCGNPDSIVDIIMMIADPAGVQIPDEEAEQPRQPQEPQNADEPRERRESQARRESQGLQESPGSQGSRELREPEEPREHRTTRRASARPLGATGHSSREVELGRRWAVMEEAGFNPLNLPPQHVDFDLRTDSWAELRMPAIEAQMSHLHAQLQKPAPVSDSLRGIFPFRHVLLTRSGRAAEEIFYSAFPRKGRVVQNLLFPTGLFHQIDNGFDPVELPCAQALQPESTYTFKGELSIDGVRERLASAETPVSLACLELANNAVGGLPVSRRHLAELKELLARHSVPLLIDATRALEHVLLERGSEGGAGDLWSEVQQILSHADVVVGSLSKDFCLDRGGVIATNDGELFERVSERAEIKGLRLDAIDRKLVALSLQERTRIEHRILRRMESVRLMWDAWRESNIPVVQPPGGHCILIDVKQIPELAALANPVASFLAWMYVNTGIRAGVHSVGMQKGTALNGLVRIAVPVGLKAEEVEEVILRLGHLFERREDIPDLVSQDGPAAMTVDPHGRYGLRKPNRPIPSPQSSRGRAHPTTDVENAASAAEPEPASAKGSRLVSATSPGEKRAGDAGTSGGCRIRDIAIIGMACRFPGARSPDEFWKNLSQGIDSVTEIPAERLGRRRSYGNGVTYRGGFIEGVDRFDSLFFNISPREAELLDPQERLFLEVAWEAIEDAGYYPECLVTNGASRNIGTFVGAIWAMYQMLGVEERSLGNRVSPNSFLWGIANRVSYFMNLCGPSLTVDTACSSSLTALHLACEAIYRGECSAAMVGGVNLDVHQSKLDINTVGGALSKDGVCRSFGKGADGYVAGEGVAALYIKPLEDAIAAGDNVHAVIKGIAINHGGRSSGYTVPNPRAQTELVLSALARAAVDARSIGYVEAHGTGTSLGDPIEATALSNAFEKHAASRQSCALGSVKTNIGHLEAAAGLAGIFKVVLQMRHRSIVPSLHSTELNELIDFQHSPFYVAQKLERWEAKEVDGVRHPLRAGVSSFGAGGSNAHMILESHAAPARVETEAAKEYILPISARDPEQLRQAASRLRDFFRDGLRREDTPLASIADVAYTLQVGRKPFECRAAVIGSCASEILERLSRIIDGAAPTDKVFTGTLKNAEAIGRLLSPAEQAELVGIVARSRDTCKLAQLWVDGLFSDWHVWVDRGAARRVSLPTYPFADRRHWIGTDMNGKGRSAREPMSRYPLIDSNESTLDRVRFTKAIDSQDFFIGDHRVSQIPTLPAVAYLELAREAAELAAGRRVRRIRNVVWLSPVALLGSGPREVCIDLKRNGDSVQFEIFSRGEGTARTLHSQGQIAYEDGKEEEPEYIDLRGILAASRKIGHGGEAYQRFEALGLQLGPSFQVLGDIYKGDSGTIGALKLPGVRHDELPVMALHPSLLDGCLQAGAAATLAEGGGEMGVPYSIGELEILQPLQAECWSHVSLVNEHGRKGDSTPLRANVVIAGPDGKVLVKVKNLVGVPLKEIHRQRPDRTADGVERLYYGFEWSQARLKPAMDALNPGAGALFFDTDSEMFRLYREQSGHEGVDPRSLVLVTPSARYEEHEDGSYEINPSEPTHYTRLLESLQCRNIRPDRICVAWAAAGGSSRGPDSVPSVSEALERGVYALLFLCQAYQKCMAAQSLRLLYLYQGNEDEIKPEHEALGAFAKTVQLEHPAISCKVVGVRNSSVSPADLLQAVTAEFGADVGSGVEVRYDGPVRSVRQIKRLELEPSPSALKSAGVAPKKGGVYLITGGAGALGFAFAEFLGREFQAKVVLSGRSELDDVRRRRLDELRETGAEVLYVSADVASREQVGNLLEETRRRFGRIDGIIHAAGVLRDSTIRSKTREQLREVLAPKIWGTLHLDDLTRDEQLDFFALFSSLAAVGGNPGQCDYAFANQFMDSFALKRESLRARGERKGKTISYNWSLWEQGGMKLPAHAQATFRKLTGVRPLATPAGLDAFVTGLASGPSQVVVAEAVRDTLERLWGLAGPGRPAGEPDAAGYADTPAGVALSARQTGDEGLESFVEGELSRLAIEMLKLRPEDLSTEKILLELGFDSIGLAEYANRINEALDLDLTPVLFFEYPSIGKLTAHLSKDQRERLAAVRRSAHEGTPETARRELGSAPEASASSPVGLIWEGARGAGPRLQTSGGVHELPPSGRGSSAEPIAIVGMSGVMPQSDDLQEFWDNLRDAKDLITVIPEDRWRWQDYFGDPRTESGKCNSKWGGFMREVDKFDPLFFGISPREAQMMDPQQRIFLQTVWHAIEDSGHKVSDFSGTRTGLFVGVATNDYATLVNRMQIGVDAYTASGNSHSVLANRVSFLLNLRGPSAPIDTACSSSLIALHRAVESILAGNCDMAIVGGVQVMLTPAAHISFSMAGMLSPDGRCKTFDKRADGYVRGEGVGAIVLKPLSRAQADGDHIYAVVKATAENHGGRVTTLTAPNPAAQTEILLDAYTRAAVDPATVGYIECHGTGTSLGDPIEVQALTKAFAELYRMHGKLPPATPHCGLSSVKTNIGHLETGAGIAGVLKVLLAIEHKAIPASLHVGELNPYINLAGSPFFIVDKTTRWEAPVDTNGQTLPRRAGISSFGFGGANAHVVLEEYLPDPRTTDDPLPEPQLIVLSAKSEERLRDYAERMRDHLRTHEVPLADFAYTLQVGRDDMTERLAFTASNIEEARLKLGEFLEKGAGFRGGYRGSARGSRQVTTVARDTEALLRRHAREELAQAWVKGSPVNWAALHEGFRRRRLPLPPYPFARERHWLPLPVAERQRAGCGQKQLHPMVHIDNSSAAECRFTSRFTGEEFYLADHRVRGQRVMPAVAYLELARAAGDALGRGAVTSIRDVAWLIPLIAGDTPNETHIVLESRESPIRFSIFTPGQSGKRVEHCRGVLRLGEPAQDAALVDIAATRARCARSRVIGADLYEFLATSQLRLGPGLQGVRQAHVGPGECLIELESPAHLSEETREYALHPAMMDGALHATIGVMKQIRPDIPWSLPSSVGVVELLGDPRLIRFAHARWKADAGGRERGALCMSFDLLDRDGRVLVRITNLEARSLGAPSSPRAVSAQVTRDAPEQLTLLAPVWNAIRPETHEASGRPPRLILLGEDASTLEWARESCPDVGTLSIASPRGVADFTSDLRGRPFDEILWVAAAPTARIRLLTDQLACQQESGVLALFRFTKALIDAGLSARPLRLTVITRRACAVIPEEETDPTHAAVSGFAGSLAKEFPHWKIRCVDIDELASLPLWELLRLPLHDQKKIYAHRGGQWLEQGFTPVAQTIQPLPAYRQGGVYVVIGGAGGLGEAWSRFMIERYQARIVWIGRRQPTAEISARIESLASAGSAPEYIAADAGNAAELSRAREQILARYPAIHGVVHSAVVLRDRSIARMSEADFRSVLSAKLETSVNMINVFGDEHLDFALFFSSVMSFSRSPGQSNYAAGCTFVDSLAQHLRGRRPYAVKVVNWGYWGGIGAVGDSSYRTRMKKLGIGSIEPDEGMQALQRLMGGSHDQLAVIKTIDPETTRDSGVGAALQPRVTPEPDRSIVLGEAMSDHVKDVLLGLASEALQLERSRIESDIPFAELGVDSIIAMRLVGRISETLGIELEPTSLFDHSTLDRLTVHIVEKWGAVIRGSDAARERPSADPGHLPDAGGRFSAVSEEAASGGRPEAIAIIGASGRFGDCESLEELWQHIRTGTDLVRDVTRWPARECALPTDRDGAFCARGSFLRSIDRFDAPFFRIQDQEALCMDPQQRLFLEESWKALEDAGYATQHVQGMQCGVYVGCGSSNYEKLFASEPPPQVFWGNSESVIPARIAYHLNLQGPAIAINTACSSSLVTVHLACQALWSREIDMALAGGVFLQATQSFYQVANRARMLSPTGACRSFDAAADGFVPAEGVGAVVLKRLRDALRDGDHIHAVIVGSGINQDGRSNGLTAPNGGAQERLERAVYDRFGIDPGTLQMLEAHGTGTPLGDSIEFDAARSVFREHTDRKQYCALGSIKANIGHAATAAGIASLLKVLLCLRHREIPAAANFERASSAVDLGSSPFYVNGKVRPWIAGEDGRRRAAVSSFSFNGTNAHLVIEDAPEMEPLPPVRTAQLVVLSARSSAQLRQQVENVLVHLGRAEMISLSDVSHTLLVGRTHFAERLACVAHSSADLTTKLDGWLKRGEASHVYCGSQAPGSSQERVSLKKFGNHCIDACREASDAEYLEHLTAIADLFAQGYTLRLERLFTGSHRRVPLPTYPFASQRYWVEATASPTIVQTAEPPESEASATFRAATESRHEVVAEAEPVSGAASGIAAPGDPRAWVELLLRCAAADELGKPALSIDTEQNFLELGLTSIGVTNFIYRVSQALGVEVAVNIVFSHPTIGALADHLASTHGPEVAVFAGSTRPDELMAAKAPSAPVTAENGYAAAQASAEGHVMPTERIRIDHAEIVRKITWTNGVERADYEHVTF